MAAYIIVLAISELYSAAYAVYTIKRGPLASALLAVFMVIAPLALAVITFV